MKNRNFTILLLFLLSVSLFTLKSYGQNTNVNDTISNNKTVEKELTLEELKKADIYRFMSVISEYEIKGKFFLENLRTINPEHLKDILIFYDAISGINTTNLSSDVLAYVAYCGVKGEADLKLWNAIITEDINSVFDYEEWSNIQAEYTSIR